MLRQVLKAAVALAMAIGITTHVRAQTPAPDAEQFYKSLQQINMIVGFGAGSGYDRWARVIVKYMPRYIPGNPTFVVKNMPGAGSMLSINHLANVAPKDGSTIAVFTRNAPSQALLGAAGIKFDPRELSWVGSPTVPSRVCVVLSDVGINSFEDLLAKEIPMGGTGPTTAPSIIPPVLNKLAGTKFKVVEGYRSSEEVHLALERKEVHGICQSLPSIQLLSPEWIKTGKLRVLFNMETKRNPKLGDVPTIFEFIKDERKKQLLNFISSSTEFGRPFAAPPGIPKDRLEVLRTAFDKTMQDPDFLAEAEKNSFEIAAMTGAEIETLVQELYAVPKDVIEDAKTLMVQQK